MTRKNKDTRLRLPKELHDELREISFKNNISMNALITMCIEKYVRTFDKKKKNTNNA